MEIVLIVMLILAGIGNGISALTAGADSTTAVEILWIGNDILLLFGLIGILLILNKHLNVLAKLSLLLAISGVAFMAGPSASIAGISAYSIAAPVVAISLLAFTLSQINTRHYRKAYLVIATGLLISIVNAPFGLWPVALIGRILFSVGLILLGQRLIRTQLSGHPLPNQPV